MEIEAPAWLRGKSLAESELRSRFGLNLVTIKRGPARNGNCGDEGCPIGVPGPETRFQEGDRLIVFGKDSGVKALGDSRG